MTYDGNIKNQELLSLREYVTMSCTVLSALFSEPESWVTYSRRASKSLFLMLPS